jgi:hypothetical protein
MICAYLGTRSRMPIPTWICPTHDLMYGVKPRHPRGRRKLGEEMLTHLYNIILIIGNSVGLESFETSYLAILKIVSIETFSSSYLLLILSSTMISVNAIRMMLERLGFSDAAATYLIGTCGVDSLGKIANLDVNEDVENGRMHLKSYCT